MENPNQPKNKFLTFGTGIWFVAGFIFYSLTYKIFYFLTGHRPGAWEEILELLLALGFGWLIRKACESIAGQKL